MDNRVFIGGNALKEIEKLLSHLKPSSVYILTDENVNRHCLPILLERCEKLKTATVIEIVSGEGEKNITTVAKIISLLLENHADRKSLLVNLGGGVIGDIGGLVASLYKRGIRFINLPTTLLAMVDASIGGKNGVNFLGHKNIVGTFNSPEGVFIYPDFIKTLTFADRRSAYAEIIKHIILSDALMWKQYQNNPAKLTDHSSIEELINHSVKFKSQVTSADFKENGMRKILNFGHTIGHALESFSHTGPAALRHGEAVAAGMIAELFLSFKLAGLEEEEMLAAVHFIRNIFGDINLNCTPEDLVPFLYADKKNAHDRIAFSLIKSPGNPAPVCYPELEVIVESLIFMNEIFSKVEQ